MTIQSLMKNADTKMVGHKIKCFRKAQKSSINHVAKSLQTSAPIINSAEHGKANISILIKEAKCLGMGEIHLKHILQNNRKINLNNLTLNQFLLRAGILKGLTPLKIARKAGYNKQLPSSKFLKEHLSVFCHIAHILGSSDTQILSALKAHGVDLTKSDASTYIKRHCILEGISLSMLAKYSGIPYSQLYYYHTHKLTPKFIVNYLPAIKNVFNHKKSTHLFVYKQNQINFKKLLKQNNFKNFSQFARTIHTTYPQIRRFSLGSCHISLRLLYTVASTLQVSVKDLIHSQHLTNDVPSAFTQLLLKRHIFTQKELATKSHMSVASINHLMNDSNFQQHITKKSIAKLAHALNVSTSTVSIALGIHTHTVTKSNTKKNNDTSSYTATNINKQLITLFHKMQSLSQRSEADYQNEMKKISNARTVPLDINKVDKTKLDNMVSSMIDNYEQNHSSQFMSNQDVAFQQLYNACRVNTVLKQLVLAVTKLNTPNAKLILNLVKGLTQK